jgi:RimJ/RimL family protein N-acetyltransferase
MDAPNDYAWRCDPELANYDAVPPLRMAYEEYAASFANELEHPGNNVVRFAIEDLSGKHIGNIMYYGIDRTRQEAELGILIGDRAYWGTGFGSDAITLLLKHIFETTEIERIYLHTLDWNSRAQGCFEKCGFVAFNKVRRGNHEFIAMQLFKKDWQDASTHLPASSEPLESSQRPV